MDLSTIWKVLNDFECSVPWIVKNMKILELTTIGWFEWIANNQDHQRSLMIKPDQPR